MNEQYLRQLHAYLERVFSPFISLSEAEMKRSADSLVTFRLTRSLVALSFQIETGCEPEEACNAITDGFGDNGIDGIYYCHATETLYFNQSKYHKNGSGSIELGETLKFLRGVRAILFQQNYSNFCERITRRSFEINQYLDNINVRIVLLITYLGEQGISAEVREELDRFVADANGNYDTYSYKTQKFDDIYGFIRSQHAKITSPIDLQVHNWVECAYPLKTLYGQVNGKALVDIIDRFGASVFSQNIRLHLGDTEVNRGILTTIEREPDLFWYYNNGITILVNRIDKYLAGGNSTEAGTFRFLNLNIVNGAQTVGTLVKCREVCEDNLSKVKVWTRFIEISADDIDTAKAITRYNNTQNRIDSRSFVALDPLQARWADELRIDSIIYTFRPGEVRPHAEEGFDFQEAAVARACANSDVSLTITAKKEVTALWNDINKAPYRLLFNRSVDGMTAYREVRVMRIVDQYIESKKQKVDSSDRQILIYGNFLLLHVVYRELGRRIYESSYDYNVSEVFSICDAKFYGLKKLILRKHRSGQVANLLKSRSICKELLLEIS